jgi:vitamin B12 transporter
MDLRTAYTFLDSVNLGGGTGAELQYRPRHRASLEAAWQFAPAFTARASVYGVADQVYFSRGAVPIETHAGDYTLVDASLTRTLASRCDVVFTVNNLFDELYEQAYGVPREGRTAFLALRLRVE